MHEAWRYDLGPWIAEATRGLCDEAKERIEREIESHCLDAYAEHKEEGMTDLQARWAAIESLGQPRAARRSFKRTYLTADEAALVENQDKLNTHLMADERALFEDPDKLTLGRMLPFFGGIFVVIGGGQDLLGPIPGVPRLAWYLLLSGFLGVLVLWVPWYVTKVKNVAVGLFVRAALLFAVLAGRMCLGWPLAKTATSLWFDRAFVALMLGYLVVAMAKALHMMPKLARRKAMAARELGEKDYKDTKD